MFGQKPADSEEEVKKRRELEEIGFTQSFVVAKGFVRLESFDALIGEDGTKRLFAQLTADPDRPDVRATEAYSVLIASMQPSWTVRVSQAFWPDPLPRAAFVNIMKGWSEPRTNEGRAIHLDAMFERLQSAHLPYTRRTLIEFVYPGPEGIPWWESLFDMFQTHNVRLDYLPKNDIEVYAHWVFNPEL
jgi:hypothetical protein